MRVDVLGVGFDSITLDQAAARGMELLHAGGAHYVVTPNPEIVEACRRDRAVMDAVNGADLGALEEALTSVLNELAFMLVQDGEGATRLMECKVSGAKDKATAKIIAKSVICSSLLKAAIFAADANWGRILCAIGYADAQFDINKIDVNLASSKGVVAVCRNGNGVEFSEDEAKKILSEDEICIEVYCNEGNADAVAWGCDLTYDYVRINADYRT